MVLEIRYALKFVRKLLEFLTNKRCNQHGTLYITSCVTRILPQFRGRGEFISFTDWTGTTNNSFSRYFQFPLYCDIYTIWEKKSSSFPATWYHLRFSIFRSLVTITSCYSALKWKSAMYISLSLQSAIFSTSHLPIFHTSFVLLLHIFHTQSSFEICLGKLVNWKLTLCVYCICTCRRLL